MRLSKWIAIGMPVAAAFGVGTAIFVTHGARVRGASAPAAIAGEALAGSAGPGERPALPEAADVSVEAADGAESTLQRELAEPEKREAAAYPWEEFEGILGRALSGSERDAMRDLRKEHGLRLAETRAQVERGEMTRERFDAWRAQRAQAFRTELGRALGCSPEKVHALLEVPLRPVQP